MVCCRAQSAPNFPNNIYRRHLLSAATIGAGTAILSFPSTVWAAAGPLTVAPEVGDCLECIGSVNDTLQTCPLEGNPSCVSTLNDDEAHFIAPWEWTSEERSAAVLRLISVATGGEYEPGFQEGGVNGISTVDAAKFVVQGVAAVVSNQPDFYPERPKPKRATSAPKFNGTLIERKTSEAGSDYVYIVFDDQSENPIDMEFLFIPGDTLVNIRAASRAPPLSNGKLGFSLTKGLVFDKNLAGKKAEELRKALKWDIAPVITDFDVSFNAEVPTVIDKIFRPNQSNFQPSGEPYPENK